MKRVKENEFANLLTLFLLGKGLNRYFIKTECTALGFKRTRTRAVLVRGA